jgi:hypothetical protein
MLAASPRRAAGAGTPNPSATRSRAQHNPRAAACTELRRPSIWKVFARAQRRFWVPFSVLILEKHPRPPNLQKTVKPQRVRFDFALKRARS